MDTLSTNALSMANWISSPHGDQAPSVSSPTKTPLHYLTGLYNYWQSISGYHTSRTNRRHRGEASQATAEICYFVILPDDVNLNILSYLDASSLCRLSQTCSHMHRITTDQLLWRHRLYHDMLTFQTLDHMTHPSVYEEVESDLGYKEIYARCTTMQLMTRPFTNGVSKMFRSLTKRFRSHPLRVVMFGSGLESLPLVRNMLWEDASPYRPVKLFPGKEGIGSGVCVRHRNNQDINLITLYTSTRGERKSAASSGVQAVNKLLSVYGDDKELTPAVQELCATIDAYIFVVNSGKALTDGLELDSDMLSTMIQCASQDTPILVWACTLTQDQQALPAVEVANQLQLIQLRPPWKVQSINIKTYSGMDNSMEWLVKCCE